MVEIRLCRKNSVNTLRRESRTGFPVRSGPPNRRAWLGAEGAHEGIPCVGLTWWVFFPCAMVEILAQWQRIFLPMQETQETQILSLGQEDPLEEDMATHSSILAWRISWTEEPGRLQSMELQRVGRD